MNSPTRFRTRTSILERFLKEVRPDDDASDARQAVVEGYATAAMFQKMVAPMKMEDMPSLEPIMAPIIQQQLEEFPAFTSAPFFFRFQALFPYIEGMGFMQRGLAAGGWKKLNSLFSDPPNQQRRSLIRRSISKSSNCPRFPCLIPSFLPPNAGSIS